MRVDHGREFYLVLTVQDHLKELWNNTSRQPYIQTQSKQARGNKEGRRNELVIF